MRRFVFSFLCIAVSALLLLGCWGCGKKKTEKSSSSKSKQTETETTTKSSDRSEDDQSDTASSDASGDDDIYQGGTLPSMSDGTDFDDEDGGASTPGDNSPQDQPSATDKSHADTKNPPTESSKIVANTEEGFGKIYD